jgi:predicted DNA-binding protein with PD1-like motif
MKATRLHEDTTETTWAIILDKGEEVVGALTTFAQEQGITAAHFTAIGAFSRATIGYFDRARKDYRRIPVTSQVEVLSLIGDVALDGSKPKLHAHAVLGTEDGTACGGHLLEGHVWPTLEVVLTESPKHLRRKMDPEVGLALIDLDKTRG